MHKKLFKDNLLEHRRLCVEAAKTSDVSQSAVAQHICVSVNGNLEMYLRKSMAELFRKRCDQKAFRLIVLTTKNFYNFKAEKIVSFFRKVYPEKAEDVEAYLKKNDVFSDAVGSIVGNKNTIAHEGRSSVTLLRVDKWLVTIIDCVDEFDDICFS